MTEFPLHAPRLVRMVTPRGRAAIATVVVSGWEAVEAVSAHFRPASGRQLEESSDRQILYGNWGPSDEAGEGIVVARLADRVEVHCHGGHQAVRAIIQDLVAGGAMETSTTASTTWHRPDRIGAATESDSCAIHCEAVERLAHATTERAALLLLDQFNGALRSEVDRIRHTLENSSIALEPSISSDAVALFMNLLDSWELGQHLVDSFQVVLAGPPNVGKSSLVNAIVGYERSIVFDQPGTTRDLLTASTAIDGWPVQICDTAGLRQALDEIEGAGVALAHQKLKEADCVVLVFDATAHDDDESELRNAYPQAIVVRNKIDLLTSPPEPSGDLLTSALNSTGIPELLAEIGQRLVPNPPEPGSPIVFTNRQLHHLRSAVDATRAGDYELAAKTLSLLTTLADD